MGQCTVYQHSKARGEIKINTATYRARRQGRKLGRMHTAGFRPGYEPDVKGGQYTWNTATASDLYKMEADLKCQGNLPQIESFFAERFSGLLLSTFESNATIAARPGDTFGTLILSKKQSQTTKSLNQTNNPGIWASKPSDIGHPFSTYVPQGVWPSRAFQVMSQQNEVAQSSRLCTLFESL
ncbi:uncharacterized protein MELLADRAFT_102627 [Melampsora larici-populina 98AG31]|uniref:Tet-like 2OG-Fe(II) oxygenase domain-containing protein n=1 Tax=Melampsora larici-populina (strain 98AG31 / pathotype 3-4-7) TaxID=747676 RepID=F4R8V8_MELLP|nr:uncharacterized protein MELLADRAFT_102627 [Melampsora larici-populina 98AG31]EGG10878.1 hypothetical protein MELLADRAFT_102627 [Melampsora larici-populina 98AG31]